MTDRLLVDDHLLLRVLLNDEPATLRPSGAEIATTGLWYHRLCRAISGSSVVGSMSRRLGGVEDAAAAAAIASIIDLPNTVRLVSLRELGWPMAELLHGGAHLNLLSLEALAAAQQLDAEICLADVDANDPLRSACAESGVRVRLVLD